MLKENRHSQRRFHRASKDELLKDEEAAEGCKTVFKDADRRISGFYSYSNTLMLSFITAALCRFM